MKSSIFFLQIGHSFKFLLHLTQAVLCLQGKYRASLSASQQMTQAFKFSILLTSNEFILQTYA